MILVLAVVGRLGFVLFSRRETIEDRKSLLKKDPSVLGSPPEDVDYLVCFGINGIFQLRNDWTVVDSGCDFMNGYTVLLLSISECPIYRRNTAVFRKWPIVQV